MGGLFSIATIMLCTAITTCVVAIALTFSSFLPGRERATRWWCCAMWAGTLGLFLLAVRAVMPGWIAIGVGNSLILTAYGIVLQGFSAFRGKRIGHVSIWLGPAIWLAAYVLAPEFGSDFNTRIILSSVLIAAYAAVISVEIWKGWEEEGLPSYMPLLVLFVTHGLVYTARAGLAFAFPMREGFDVLASTWLAVLTMEVFVHVIGLSFTIFALSKERAELRYRLAAEIDGLTSASTRRYFVSQTRERLTRNGLSGALAVIDLDYFKSINDSHGHLAGDRVLQAFGEHVSGRLAPGMLFGRLGGEEFALYLPGMDEVAASAFIEQLRGEIEAMDIVFMAHRLKVTLSAGVALVERAGADFDHVMAAADAALYLAKDEGRNRVKLFTPSMRLHTVLEGDAEARLGVASGRISRRSVRGALKSKSAG